MTTFTVISSKDMTAKTGKPYKSLVISDGPNETKVNIFSDFPDFANIKTGSRIEGTLEQNGQYWNLKSDRLKERKPFGNAGIKEAMKQKEESISKFQGNKEESIKLAGSSRDATLIVTTFYPEFAEMQSPEKEEFIKRKWNDWKDYFLLGF